MTMEHARMRFEAEAADLRLKTRLCRRLSLSSARGFLGVMQPLPIVRCGPMWPATYLWLTVFFVSEHSEA